MSSAKVKTTFRLDRKIVEDFMRYVKSLGLRRDQYLNRVLREASGMLRTAKPNSEAAAKFALAVREAQSSRFIKVGITLDQTVVERINKTCGDKRIPRDAFVEYVIKYLVHGPEVGDGYAPLPQADTLLDDPWSSWVGYDDQHFFDGLTLGDLSQADLTEFIRKARS